jgi:oligosaccharide repeat unit polymerase
MEFLMLAVLIALVLFAYFFENKDLVSPWFLLCLAILASYFIVLLNYTNWQVSININFVVYVTTAILAFGFGCGLINIRYRRFVFGDVNKLNKELITQSEIKSKYPANIFLFISVVCSVIYLVKICADAGSASSINQLIRNIYNNITGDDYSTGFIFTQMLEIVVAIAYINTYRLFVKLFRKDKKISAIKLIIPIIMFFVVVMIWSDRNIFLRYAIYFVCLFVLFFRENYKKTNANKKIIVYVFIVLCVAVIAFYLLGKVKQYTSNLTRMLGIYGGSGLYNFNLWIDNFNDELSFGSSTFSTFLRVIEYLFNLIGVDLNNFSLNSRFDVFITYRSTNGYVYSSNIYSALKPFVEDFGYFGVIFYPFIMGLFYQWLYVKMRRKTYSFHWILYCMLIYPTIYFPILDQLFNRFTLGFVYELFWITVIYFYAFKSKSSKKSFITYKVKQSGGAK